MNKELIDGATSLGCGCLGIMLALTLKLAVLAGGVWLIVQLVKLFW